VTLAEEMKVVLDHLKRLPATRERSLAITKLEECAFWAACAVQGVVDPIAHLSNEKPTKPAS